MKHTYSSKSYLFVTLVVVLTMAVNQLAVLAAPLSAAEPVRPERAAPAVSPEEGALFRTRVTLRQPRDRERLAELGVVFLEEGDDAALLLVTSEQLETLARLRFEPVGSDEAGALAAAYADSHPWLIAGLQPVLRQAREAQQLLAATAQEDEASRQQVTKDLQSALAAVTLEQRAALADFTSLDDDADGLTNTQESWWCTNPLDADTDDDGKTDGAEIQVLRDWMGNRRAGPPMETPWPNWPAQIAGCEDKDYDSVPNLAERWEMGLNMDLESTDRDRYDDGQELFGTTYCPGSANACGYGTLPSANHDGIVLFPQMPSWVEAPGNHPNVAALPQLEFTVVPDQNGKEFTVQTATVITVDERHEESETKSYSTTKTEGTSTSETDTETWENWQEYTKTTEAVDALNQPQATLDNYVSVEQRLQTTNVRNTRITNVSATQNNYDFSENPNYLDDKQTQAADFILNEACDEFSCRKYAGSAIRASVRTFSDVVQGTLFGTSDKIQNEFENNNCDPTSFDPSQIWCRVKSAGTLWKANYDERVDAATYAEQEARGLAGGNYMQTGDSYLDLNRVYPISFPVPKFTPTESNTTGSSTGGARSTTTTQYEEHAVTEGTSNQFGTSWGTATAENSVHAADLWFAYELANSGDDYAREICNLTINVYIGEGANPDITYYPGADLGGSQCFVNFRPGETHQYSFPSQSRIQLTLDQLAAIDQGESIRFAIEDYSLGQDDFYADDAVTAGVTVSIDDNSIDGNQIVDTYLIPTWGSETAYDVLARYFPNETDADGNLTAIWTPEYRSDTPSWCVEPQVVGSGSQRTLWCKHALSTADWWNIYTNGLGDGTEGFQDTPASPGSMALFRFNKDSDLDGYSDRSEDRLGTDKDDPSDYPRPELLAGYHSTRSANHVTGTLSLLNTGLYDAYGVEAVMVAPDDSISITNNTVGGSGRVRAQRDVVVGSRILLQNPLPSPWGNEGHATPTVAGYYTGGQDRTYTFTVNCTSPCSVGAGTWSLAWNDGTGNSGSLNFSSGYDSPTHLDVGAFGLQLALLSGTVNNGESFTVEARTPRDTFQYDIVSEPYTPPLVLVSYNDPQGNHRFLIPEAAMDLSSPTEDLLPFSGTMFHDPGVEIVTSAPHNSGANTTNLVVSNPSGVDLNDAYLFLEFIDPNGDVVLEVPVQTDLPAGPSVVPVDWDTADFDPAYDPDSDYIVMAFWTDYQGNILDTAARPLSSFQEDPQAIMAYDPADLTWDFGTARQGTLLQRPFILANTGYMDLLSYIGEQPGISIEGPSSLPLSAADMGVYQVSINTGDLLTGPFLAEIPIRSSDANDPEQILTIQGDILPFTADSSQVATIRPLDEIVTITDGTQGEWVTYTLDDVAGENLQSLQPVKVYSDDYTTFWGVGKYATDFSAGTAPGDMFGDGRDGAMPASGNLNNTNGVGVGSVSGTLGSTTVSVTDRSSVGRINPGDVVLVHQTQGTGAGNWELNEAVDDFTGNGTFALKSPLQHNYSSGSGSNHAQIQRVPQYTSCDVSGTITPVSAWNGVHGGIIAVICRDSMTVSGSINAAGNSGVTFNGSGVGVNTIGGGFRGGAPDNDDRNGSQSQHGEGHRAPPFAPTSENTESNGNGGGAGTWCGAGGGGHASVGGRGLAWDGKACSQGGESVGDLSLDQMYLGGGGGGGSGSWWQNGGHSLNGSGGSGGGIVVILARILDVSSGSIIVNGGDGGDSDHSGGSASSAGGGGAGGSIYIVASHGSLDEDSANVDGGQRGIAATYDEQNDRHGGNGSSGRIRIEYCDSLVGTTGPATSTEKLQCHILEQVDNVPYDQGKFSVPETFSGARDFVIQYGHHLDFAVSGNQTTSIRIPKQVYTEATLDALVSNTGAASADLQLSLDIAANNNVDWSHNATTAFPATLTAGDLANALNAYLIGRDDAAWGEEVDVPVKVSINRAGELLLTNLELTAQVNQPAGVTTARAEKAGSVDTSALLPLDWPVYVAGAHGQGEWITYDHTLGPTPETLQPVKVYSQDYSSFKGAGRYSTDFSADTAPGDMFGDGRHGNLNVASGQVTFLDYSRAVVSGTASQGSTSLSFANTTGNIFQKKDQHPRQQWTATGFRIAAGERLVITPDDRGHPDLHKICYAGGDACYGPNGGGGTATSGWTAPGIVKHSLVGRIGNGSPFLIGSNFDQTIPTSGELYLGLNDCDSCFGDNNANNGSVGFGFNIWVYHTATPSFSVGDQVIVIQMTGSNVGAYELKELSAASATQLTFTKPLENTYLSSGSSRAQVVELGQYETVTVLNGGQITSRQWDGYSGGVMVLMARQLIDVQAGGSLSASSGGFSGGTAMPWSDSQPGYQGSSYNGLASVRSIAANAGAGGGGQNNAGGGGGYGSAGQNGVPYTSVTGRGGGSYGSSDLSRIYLGSGGGGSSHAYGDVARGGFGGGILVLIADEVRVAGSIESKGQGGGQAGYTVNYAPDSPLGTGRAGGGGAGGSILLRASGINIGTNKVIAVGGNGGRSTDNSNTGGSGGNGRIRIEYCNLPPAGNTTPLAILGKITCHIVEQVESPPYQQGRLNLPESFSNGRTYNVQYGRRFVFGGAGVQTASLRLPKQVHDDAALDVLVSNGSSGTLAVSLDIGNDSTFDWTYNASATMPATLQATSFVDDLNAYLESRSDVAWGEDVDVPVRVSINRQAEVILTNLALYPVGAKTRYLRLPAEDYDKLTVDLAFDPGSSGSGPLAFTLDVGGDGTVDDTFAATVSFPAVVTTSNLAAAVNAYLSGKSGDVDIPIVIVPSPFMDTALVDADAVPAAEVDATVSSGDISFSAASPVEDDAVQITATLHNLGGLDSGGVTAAFFAQAPDGREWYIGSTYVPNVPGGGTAQAVLAWDTLGFNGAVPVRVEIDPYDRLAETNEANNAASKSLTILTRPDLALAQWAFSDAEPVVGEATEVTATVNNSGQAAAAAASYSLYDGNPDDGGLLVETIPGGSIAGAGAQELTFDWTPAALGAHQLFLVLDENEAVNESDEGNNRPWQTIYAGLPGPVLLDSGNAAADPAFSEAAGFGVVDDALAPDMLDACNEGAEAAETFRLDPGGAVVYRFKHLQPGHFYHLDVTLYECDGVGRQESIYIDAIDLATNAVPVAGPFNLGNGEVRQISLLVDPAFYADREIEVTIHAPGIDGAVVSEVNLHDIDYRYADAGGGKDPQYTAVTGYGWHDGVASTTWGTLPYQSARVDLGDNELRYQFDGLQPQKQYNLNFTFWQPSGTGRIQNVIVDGVTTDLTVNTGDLQLHRETVTVPPGTYDDGTITARIVRTNAATGAMVNEIALEELTLLSLPKIRDVMVSNVNDISATISWITDEAATGSVSYGQTSALGQVDQDNRGGQASYLLHYVTLTGLSPNTTYYFAVNSDNATDDNDGSLYSFTTGPTISLPGSDIVYGQVMAPNGVDPAEDALVTLVLRDQNGQDSTGEAALLSSLVDNIGYWNTNLGTARTADLQALYIYSFTGDQLEIHAENGEGCSATAIVDTAADSPAPTLTLNCDEVVEHTVNNGWSLIGSVLTTDPTTTASIALAEIDVQGGNAKELHRWQNGGWQGHVKGLLFNNFDLELGRGYFVKAAQNSVWERRGLIPDTPQPLSLIPSWNLVSFATLPGPRTAAQILSDIQAQGGNCSEIDRFDYGSWQGHILGLPFNNFAIDETEGYFVKCAASGSYTPDASTTINGGPWRHLEPQVRTANENVRVSKILVTNRRDVAVTITWETDQPSDGFIMFGPEGKARNQKAVDERGKDTVARQHQVTLTGLTPETTYEFDIHSGSKVLGPTAVTTTASALPLPPFTAYGQIQEPSGNSAIGALVLATVEDKQGNELEPLSALVDGFGYWVLNLPVDDCTDYMLRLDVRGERGSTAETNVSTCDLQPAPTITLKEQTEWRLFMPVID